MDVRKGRLGHLSSNNASEDQYAMTGRDQNSKTMVTRQQPG